MYIWLKEDAEETLKKLQESGLLKKIKVETNEDTGRKFISIYADVFSPAAHIPAIPPELVEKVTLKAHNIYRGFRAEGIYRYEGAELLVKTEVHVTFGSPAEREDWQEINISAPSIVALKTIYTMVRQGKLTPEENWDDFTPSVTAAAESVSEGEKEGE